MISQALDSVLGKHAWRLSCHFAGLKAVGESVTDPLRYYENNVVGTMACSTRCVVTG